MSSPYGCLLIRLQAFLPEGFSGLVALFRNWTYALFYIMSELWGSVAISLFSGDLPTILPEFPNQKVSTRVFGLGANVAMLVSGPAIIYFSISATSFQLVSMLGE